MKKFYEQEDESFQQKIKKRNKKLFLLILSFLIFLFIISLLPLIYFFTVTYPFGIFRPTYFLDTTSPIGIGSYIFKNEKYLLFLSDIFSGGFKPLVYISENDTYLKALEFSDSLSHVDGYNLFNDTKVVLNVDKKYLTKTLLNSFTQKYYKNDSLLLEKNVKIQGEKINFTFILNDSVKDFNLVFYSENKIRLENNLLKINKEVCELLFNISYDPITGIKIRPTRNTIDIFESDKKEFSLSMEFIDDNCKEKGISDEFPIKTMVSWIYFLYPLLTIILIGLFWRSNANR